MVQVKEHVCTECGKAFGQKGDLVKHIKTIHEQVRIGGFFWRCSTWADLVAGKGICLPSVHEGLQREREHDKAHTDRAQDGEFVWC